MMSEPREKPELGRAVSSAGEHTLHTRGVTGSIPVTPTVSSASTRVCIVARQLEPPLFVLAPKPQKMAAQSEQPVFKGSRRQQVLENDFFLLKEEGRDKARCGDILQLDAS